MLFRDGVPLFEPEPALALEESECEAALIPVNQLLWRGDFAEADELLENSRQERREFEADQHKSQDELRVRLEESRTRLAQMREEADGQRARLDAELAERRAREEQALASAIDSYAAASGLTAP